VVLSFFAQKLRPQPRLLFWLTDKPFKLDELASLTPSGEAPTPMEVGGLTFYYNGSGGDLVGYSDHYFFNLRGELLDTEFDDPYVSNPSSDENKESEQGIRTRNQNKKSSRRSGHFRLFYFGGGWRAETAVVH
jgi:hypothetical protein